MRLPATWEKWLAVRDIPLSLLAPLIICGPYFNHCHLTRTGMCAVQMRGLTIVENWWGLEDQGLCRGIENARAVHNLNQVIGTAFAGNAKTSLQKFLQWAHGKQGVVLPQALLDASQQHKNINGLSRTVYIKHSLFQGKKPKEVVKAMQSYDEKFIAHVLVEYNKVDKTRTGKLLYPGKAGVHDERVYRAYADKLLKDAAHFIITPVAD